MGWVTVELCLKVPILETVDGELPGQDRDEEDGDIGVDGVERRNAAPVDDAALA
jgi:hypothetical protein